MLAIGPTLVSEELIEEQFCCDLEKCKGACCVAGDAGAPLALDELKILEEIYEKVKPFMTEEGKRTIEKKGLYVYDKDDKEWVTPLIERSKKEIEKLRQSPDKNQRARAELKECAFTQFENGVAKCSIEQAYKQGVISFQKPVSCHLYPVRIKKFEGYDAVNYNQWSVCAPACALGKKLKLPVYSFVKDALTRKYGQEWFSELDKAAKLLVKKRKV